MPTIKHISLRFGEKQIFDNFTLDLPDGGRYCLFGASGCGKTTLLRLLAGLQSPDSGEITGVKRSSLSMCFQEDRLIPSLSAEKNVAFVSDLRKARELLSAVGFTENDMQLLPSRLSGGMQRRVAVARALSRPASLLLLDEPFKGLDEALKEKTIALILRLQQEGKFGTIVFTTHIEQEIEAMQSQKITLGR